MRLLSLALFVSLGLASAQTCAGFPRLAVTTPSGFCVGIISRDLRFPRGLLPLPSGDLLVVEMAGWSANRGSLAWLHKQGNQYRIQRLLNGLDRPHGIALGQDGRVYVGEVGRIFRFDPEASQPRKEYIIHDLPGNGRHPLTQMVFDGAGHLFVNVGSASDNCQQDKGKPACAEAGRNGLIRRYTFQWPQGSVRGWSVYATGLRNSMALAIHPSGTLLQGENSRDAIQAADPRISDEAHPADELNVVVQGTHYGWPYCYENGKNAPEFPRYNCAQTRNPTLLLPAHAAPLGMAYLSAQSELGGNWLVVGYHGYRKTGHRLVAFRVDGRGIPSGPAVELIGNWVFPDGKLGAPVDMKVGPDGKIYITDDRNGMLLVFSRG
ncbi:PQQ-dependent sugar dehydrogenase [uncultured Meiothermus sp.]|uniref:PQQ-dependent sugar dehydrogenase n=1 Tax=uncultured Meiothermus sp. TaxID=157471 RepID=UPI002623F817|nr:PQQ-dependent sugar dehydrogenase [uncultured Meiothermus sp.]